MTPSGSCVCLTILNNFHSKPRCFPRFPNPPWSAGAASPQDLLYQAERSWDLDVGHSGFVASPPITYRLHGLAQGTFSLSFLTRMMGRTTTIIRGELCKLMRSWCTWKFIYKHQSNIQVIAIIISSYLNYCISLWTFRQWLQEPKIKTKLLSLRTGMEYIP